MAQGSAAQAVESGKGLAWWKSLLLPGALIAAIGIILIPMPAPVMDFLLAFNLTLSVLILLTTVFIRKPLDFSSFPTVLLAVVMFRLGLNIASTRLILSRAETDGTEAAGRIIQAFSDFVTAGNLVVGIILFLIILIIQFVVITKGAGRISEVSARFTLDGLPGKQMAIDAELQSGAITQEEAKERRLALGDEVDFYGAMDGASKFVRGDAVAGLAITFINILAGMAIGLTSGGHTVAETAEIYTRLTIGDGLVSQLPAFLVAIGAALLVTRSNREKKLAQDVQRQLFSRPAALMVTGGMLAMLALTPLPKLPLLILAVGCEILAGMLWHDEKKAADLQAAQDELAAKTAAKEQTKKAAEVQLAEAIQTEAIQLELGADLLAWLPESSDEAKPEVPPMNLLDEIQNVRRKLAQEFGFLMPAVRVTGGEELDGNVYRIRVHGSVAAEQVLRLDSLLAVEGLYAGGELEGLKTSEPIQKRAAVWISPDLKDDAEADGYEVWTPGEVLTRHLAELATQFAPELLTHDDVQNLLDELAKTSPAAVRDVVPETLSVQEIQRVLQRLLAERVPIRSLGRILETLGRAAQRTKNPVLLTEAVRAALGRLITSRNLDADGLLRVLTLSPDFEAKIAASSEISDDSVSLFPTPAEQGNWVKLLTRQCQKMEMLGVAPVLLVSPAVRPAVRELTAGITPQPVVLSYAEVPKNVKVQQQEMLGLES
ncbi:MAG: FHIPEP family type III secretion protein [Thermoguttaceae bacterium]|nr:FHIPEP family type III secretion protein [Thermoguttaceae bacterium]